LTPAPLLVFKGISTNGSLLQLRMENGKWRIDAEILEDFFD
jgi:hypothetical protein